MTFTKSEISETKAEIKKGIKEGRGQGSGRSYKPWISVIGGPTGGGSSLTKGITVERCQETLSNHEAEYRMILDFAEKVVDVREQFPLLDLDLAMEIADEMGVDYPEHDGRPAVMTVDFLITLEDEDGSTRNVARTYKDECKLENGRNLEKFEIERRYVKRKMGIDDYKIVTEREVPHELAQNCGYILRRVRELGKIFPKGRDEKFDKVGEAYLKKAEEGKTLVEVNHEIEREFGLGPDVGPMIFCRLVREGKIKIDLEERLEFSRTLEEVKL